MTDSNWKEVAQSEDLEAGKLFSAELSEEESVLIIRRDNGLVAWGNSCPHAGCPLSWGHMQNGVITCACHNARFDVKNGEMLTAPSLDDLVGYEVREENGKVYVGASHKPEFPRPAVEESKTVAIVGAGAGGSAAAEQLRREGFGGRIVMITPEEGLPYDRTALSKFFLVKDMEPGLMSLRSAQFYEDAEIELWNGRRVTAVDTAALTLTLDDGSSLQADHIILATGSRAKTLPIPGTELSGCFTLRSLTDAIALREAAAKAKNAVVLGASFIGTETAAFLKDRGLDVHIVAPESVPFAAVLGERVGKRFAALHESQGVKMKLDHSVSRIKGSEKVEEVELDDGTILPAELVVLGVGAEPVLDYLEGTGLVRDGAVPVDAHLSTSASGIYAIGDIARVDSDVQNGRAEHWVVAQRHGQQAARAVMGDESGLKYAPFFWTMQFETPLAYIGLAPDFDEARYKGDVEEGNFLAGYFKDGRLAAVASIGKTKTVARYGYLLDEGRKIGLEDFDAGLKKMNTGKT
ncbi:MAG: FAD-dependent oxidoreductase [Spirochaetia bacterium]